VSFFSDVLSEGRTKIRCTARCTEQRSYVLAKRVLVYGTKIRCAGERGDDERQRSDVLLANRGREVDVLLANGGREQRMRSYG
jgi:hypothetical protein